MPFSEYFVLSYSNLSILSPANGFFGPSPDCSLVAIEAALLSSNRVWVAGAAEARPFSECACIVIFEVVHIVAVMFRPTGSSRL